MKTNRHKVLLNKPYLDSNDSVELFGLLIGAEVTLRDFIAIEAKHGLPIYYKGELLSSPRLCLVTQSSTSAKHIGHYDESEDETETVYFAPTDIKTLADVVNGGLPDPRLEELKEENKRLREQLGSNPTNSAYVIAGALIELLTEKKTPRRNQTQIKLELEETGLKGLSKASLDKLFAAANTALKASKDAAK